MSAPAGVERDYPLARLTTIRTGGPADWFARPDSRGARWRSCLAWADAEGIEVGVVGSGSNLLVADDGFRGLVLKLDGALAAIERDGDRLLCGGGARLPQAAAKRRARGPHRPRVRREHPRHRRRRGEDERQRLRRRPLARARVGGDRDARRDASGAARRARLPATGARTSQPREVVARAVVRARAAPTRRGQGHARRHARRSARRPSRPGIKTFGSTFKNPDDPRAEGRTAGVLLEAAGCRGLQVGGARFSEKHANFVENMGEATTADVIALMAEGRRRVRERVRRRARARGAVPGRGRRERSSTREAAARRTAVRRAAAARRRCRRRVAPRPRWRLLGAGCSCSRPPTGSGSATRRSSRVEEVDGAPGCPRATRRAIRAALDERRAAT